MDKQQRQTPRVSLSDGKVLTAANIKIKRNLKKRGIVGYQTFAHLMKCVQVQKMRTTLWHKFFFCLFAFFAGTFRLRIPSFLNFVNPFFVMCHSLTTMLTRNILQETSKPNMRKSNFDDQNIIDEQTFIYCRITYQ